MAAEILRISDQLRRAVHGEAWHGPSVMETLKGVDADTAAAHPIAGAHSIWELLHHITAWTRAIMRRIDGHAVELSGDTDFPPVTDRSEAAWQGAISSFRDAQSELLTKLKSVSNGQLDDTVPGRNYTYLFMFDGLVQHHLYHAGQMALLKKAAALKH
jgi:uncharacterized damage-inducible protein DinB